MAPTGKFLFDVAAWRGSRAIQRMSFAERGVYLEMLLEQWEKGSLPDNPEEVADAIASSHEQIAEVVAAWPATRRKFLTNARGDIFNDALERTRRQQRSFINSKRLAGREGGKAKAANHSKDTALEASTATAVPESAVAQPSVLSCLVLSSSDLSSSDQKPEPSARRDFAPSVLTGSLPRDHVSHVVCSPNFAWCVPSAVHGKLANLLAPQHGNDRAKADATLRRWYPTVWDGLPATTVMGDAFAFWQRRFDAAFASKPQAVPARGAQSGDAARALADLRGGAA